MLETILLLSANGMVVVILACGVIGYSKLRVKILNIKESRAGAINDHFKQIEALIALYYRLRPKIPLPAMRGWAASPDFLAVIADQIMESRPRVIVECSSGVSTVVAARCVQLSGVGHVFSLEHDPLFAAKTRHLLEQQGLSAFATVVDAPLIEISLPGWRGPWYDDAQLQLPAPPDMLIVDGPPYSSAPLARYPALPRLIGLSRRPVVVLLDDADRPDEALAGRLWLEQFPTLRPLDLPACEKGCLGYIIPKEDCSGR